MSYPKDTKRKNGDEKGKKQKGRLVTGGENKLVILVTAGNNGRKFTYAAAVAIIILVEIKSRKGEDPRPSTEPAGCRGHTPRGPMDVAETPTSQKRSPEQLILLLFITLGTLPPCESTHWKPKCPFPPGNH